MITQTAILGLATYLFVTSFFQLSQEFTLSKKAEGWDELSSAQQFLVEKPNYDAAIYQLLNLIKRYKDDQKLIKQAKYWLGIAYYKNKQYEDMFNIFKELIKLYPDEEIGKMGFFFIGEYYFYKKNYPYAIASYEMFIQKIYSNEYTPLAYFNICKAYYEEKKIPQILRFG